MRGPSPGPSAGKGGLPLEAVGVGVGRGCGEGLKKIYTVFSLFVKRSAVSKISRRTIKKTEMNKQLFFFFDAPLFRKKSLFDVAVS